MIMMDDIIKALNIDDCVVDGHEIDQVVKTKFFGVVTDTNLNWK